MPLSSSTSARSPIGSQSEHVGGGRAAPRVPSLVPHPLAPVFLTIASKSYSWAPRSRLARRHGCIGKEGEDTRTGGPNSSRRCQGPSLSASFLLRLRLWSAATRRGNASRLSERERRGVRLTGKSNSSQRRHGPSLSHRWHVPGSSRRVPAPPPPMVDNDEEVECNTIVRAREEGCDLAGGWDQWRGRIADVPLDLIEEGKKGKGREVWRARGWGRHRG